MKIFRKTILSIFIIPLLSPISGFCYCQKSPKSGNIPKEVVKIRELGEVISVFGNPFLRREKESFPLGQGTKIFHLDFLDLGLEDKVHIQLEKGEDLFFGKNTNCQIYGDNREKNQWTILQLEKGGVFVQLSNEKKDRKFSIHTDLGAIHVLGTTFMAQVTKTDKDTDPKKGKIPCVGDGCKLKVSVIEGKVTVQKKDTNQQVQVEKNQKLNINSKTILNEDRIKALEKKSLSEIREMLITQDPNYMGIDRILEKSKWELESKKLIVEDEKDQKQKQSKRKKELYESPEPEMEKPKNEVHEKLITPDIHKEKLKIQYTDGDS